MGTMALSGNLSISGNGKIFCIMVNAVKFLRDCSDLTECESNIKLGFFM